MADDDSRRIPPPAPHLVLAPAPWVDERDLPYLDEPEPDRSCARCGREDRRLEAELHAAREVLGALEELLDWIRDEHAVANVAREEADREARGLRVLLAEFEIQAGRYVRVIDRARTALARARAEREQERKQREKIADRVGRYERYVAALEARLKAMADAPEPAAAATRDPSPVRPSRRLARPKS